MASAGAINGMLGGRPPMGDICRYLKAADRVRLWESANGPVPEGMRVASTCAVSYCGKLEHMELTENLTSGWNNWKPYRDKAGALEEGESFDIPDLPESKIKQFTAIVHLWSWNDRHFLVRSLPSGGVRLIRYGTFYQPVSEFHEAFPVLDVKQPAPCHSLRPGAFYLGFLWNGSMHAKDVPKDARCQARACAFPAYDGMLCHHHLHFFDFKIAASYGRYIDDADIYGDEKTEPRFYVSQAWKIDKESLKYERKDGGTEWWRKTVLEVEARQLEKLETSNAVASLERGKRYGRINCARKVRHDSLAAAEAVREKMRSNGCGDIDTLQAYECRHCDGFHLGTRVAPEKSRAPFMTRSTRKSGVDMGATIPGLHRGVGGLHHGKKPRKLGRGIKASQKGRWAQMLDNRNSGDRRTQQKPTKRWSREALELEANLILADAGFFAEPDELLGDVVPEVLAPEIVEAEEREDAAVAASAENWEEVFGAQD